MTPSVLQRLALAVDYNPSGLTFNPRGAPIVKAQLRNTAKLRVTKKLSPESRGALKLSRQFGEALVCVRHRSDDRGEFRYTTVELLVEKVAIQPRNDKLVTIHIAPDEKSLHSVVKAAGGKWDFKLRLWRLPRRVVGILKLTDRITEK